MSTAFNDLKIIEIYALGLWLILIVILIVALVLSIVFYKKTKSNYAFGLIFLCIGFIIGRIFRILIKFFIGEPTPIINNLYALIFINFVLWSTIGLIFILGGLSLTSKRIKGYIFIIYWLGLIIALIILTSKAISLIESNIGPKPSIIPFEGTALLFENIALTSSWLGFIVLFYYVEKVSMDLFSVKKIKHLFTVLTVFAMLFTIIENYTGNVTYILIIFFMSSMAGMGSVFFYIAKTGTGTVRKNAIFVMIGHLLLAFSFILDIPSGYFLFLSLPEIVLLLIPPIFQIIGLIFYIRGLLPNIFYK